MAVEVGQILEGKVTGIKKFGAFITLPEGETGMVHISEVSSGYVENLTDILVEGQMVKVKVLTVENGKIALSIKRAQAVPAQRRTQQRADTGKVWQPKAQSAPQSEMTFEEKMSQFKSRSEEKISDLRKVTEARRGGGYSRRGH